MWDQIVSNFIAAPKIHAKPAPATHKVCRDCGQEKPNSEFYERSTGAKHTSRCKPCYMLHNKKYKENKRGKTV